MSPSLPQSRPPPPSPFLLASPLRTVQKLSTIDEERGVQVGKSEMQALRSMGPSSSALVRSSSQEHPDDGGGGGGGMAKSRSSSGRRPKTVPFSQSMGSEESSIVSDKVNCAVGGCVSGVAIRGVFFCLGQGNGEDRVRRFPEVISGALACAVRCDVPRLFFGGLIFYLDSSKPFLKPLPHGPLPPLGSRLSAPPLNPFEIRAFHLVFALAKFTYTNPMHKGEEIKKTGSPNEYGDDLAQHYEG